MKFNHFISSGYFSNFLKYLKAETSSSQFQLRSNPQYYSYLLVNNPLIWYKEPNLQTQALKFYLENISFLLK
jgi:hypothetical protein